LSKLVVLKRLKIKSKYSLRFTMPEAFILQNDINIGDELIVFMAESGEMVIRKSEKKLDPIKYGKK
jgi:hypothetical protein